MSPAAGYPGMLFAALHGAHDGLGHHVRGQRADARHVAFSIAPVASAKIASPSPIVCAG